ncbi:MAG: RNA-directed DNA polymerase, partial [Chloroflexota bacterium]|nr:RNA-directed DNA polymerase [Chloroflexota bacterium]
MALFDLSQYFTVHEMFISSENFRLAWERVRYFDRMDSRDWIGLKVFAANRDHNLKILRQSVIEKTFEPSYPEIKYLPKSSLTLRPMAVLAIPDRIVLQALANVIAEKSRFSLGMVANRQSFANVLEDKKEKRFFVRWKLQYGLFQKTYLDLIDEGNSWVAETDIAAFYEAIEHSKLYSLLLDNDFIDEPTLEYLKQFLPVWGAVKVGYPAKRGVPQGCLASDLFANIFLYEFDRKLSTQEFHYLRYVDDVRIVGSTKASVQRGLIQVDIFLKSLGILLQTKKTNVRPITDKLNESDRLSAELSELDRRLDEIELTEKASFDPLSEPSLHDVALLGMDSIQGFIETTSNSLSIQNELREIFWNSKNSIDKEDLSDPYAERHLKFCLYRLEPNEKIAEAVIPYLTERPWLTDIISGYLRKGKLKPACIAQLKNIVSTHDVYDSVVATALEILLAQHANLRSFQNLLRQWLQDENKQWTLRSAAALCLGESSENISLLHQQALNLNTSPSVRRMCLIQSLRLSKNPDEALHITKSVISDFSPVVIDTLLYQIYVEGSLTLNAVNQGTRKLSDYCIAMAKGYDDSLPNVQFDFIRLTFSKSYLVEFSESFDFHPFLADGYKLAVDKLWHADREFLHDYDRYVNQLDQFHEELLTPI